MKCDFCQASNNVMYDAKTTRGPWANMCHPHFLSMGVGLGTGLGQKYRYSASTRTWKKVAG